MLVATPFSSNVVKSAEPEKQEAGDQIQSQNITNNSVIMGNKSSDGIIQQDHD